MCGPDIKNPFCSHLLHVKDFLDSLDIGDVQAIINGLQWDDSSDFYASDLGFSDTNKRYEIWRLDSVNLEQPRKRFPTRIW
jgi:hypothetical protein